MANDGGEQSFCSESFESEDLDDLKCQPCHEEGRIREAVGICLDCQDYLCQRCFDGHTIPKPSRHHQLLNKVQMLKSEIQLQRKDKCTQKCSQHDDEVVKYFCTDHSQLGCSVCVNLDHRSCKVQYIPTFTKDLDSNMECKHVQQWLQSVQQRSQIVSDTTVQNAQLIDSSCVEALKKIDKHRSNVNVALDNIQTDLIKKVDATKTNEKEKLNEIVEKHQRVSRELQSVQTNIATFKATGQNCNLYIEIMKMKDKLNPLEAEIKKVENEMSNLKTEIVFIPNKEHLDILQNPETFGTLSEQGNRNIVKSEPVKDINVAYSTDTQTGPVMLSENMQVVAGYKNMCTKIVDAKRNQFKSSRSKNSGSILDPQ